jgi:hypothetical protein
MGKSHRAKKTAEQYQKAADLLGEGLPVSQALAQAGWSQASANKGVAAIPEGVLKLLPKKQMELIALGKSISKDDIQHGISGRLFENVVKGSDKGVQSAKVLGSRKDLAMWQPDAMTGVIVLQAPQSAIDNKARLLSDEE